MKLNNTQINSLVNAISGLTNPKEGEGKPLPFRVAYALARTLSALKPLAEATDLAVKHAITEYSGGKAGLDPDSPHFQTVTDNISIINNTVIEVDVHKVKSTELEKLLLTPAQISALLPIIDDGDA